MKESKSVTISNELTRSAYSLSLNEKRLIMFAVSKLDNHSDDSKLLSINAIECARFYKMSESSARRHLKKAMDALWDRELVTPDGVGHRWIISRGKYDKGDLMFKFHTDLEPHLFDLKNRFTRYYLENAADFKHVYSWRIFELIMQFKSTGFLTIELDKFKSILELPESYNRDFATLNRRVLKPALLELKLKSGIDVKLNAKKTGRKITSLEFRFPVEIQTEIPNLDSPVSEINQALIDRYVYENPKLTTGKNYTQIIRQLKEVHPKAKVNVNY